MHADVRHGPERKGRYRVVAGMVFLCGKASETTIDMTLTDKEGLPLAGGWHKVLLWVVEEEDAALALAEVENDFDHCWGLLFWLPLMAGAALPLNIAAWLRLVARVPSKRHRADLFRIALVFAELAGTLPKWREALKEADMKDSPLVLEWTADARLQERVETLPETLLRLAGMRFKGELTDEDRQMMSTQDSAAVLREWLDAVIQAKDYTDFRAVLRR